MALRLSAVLLLLADAPLDSAQQALQAAQNIATAHRAAAAQAKLNASQVAARAAALARQQIIAAAALRALEEQTSQAAATLASLDAQSQTAKQSLQQNEAALTALLPIMERLSSQPAAAMLAVPASPTDAVRGILVLQGIAAEIERRAREVRVQAQLVASLQNQTRAQQAVLVQAVATQQKAEAALSTQIAAASAAETADLDTAAREAAAEAAADQNIQSLQGMINKLRARERAAAARHAAKRNFPPTPGGAPVAGTIVQAYGAPTVAGPAVGLVYRAAPAARVVAPCAGPILYANRFQSYGLLIIMDCGNNYDFVLSGMRHLDVTAGQDIARGQPVGEMAGFDPKNPAQQPLLYVELRLNGTPVNPAAWLAGGGSG